MSSKMLWILWQLRKRLASEVDLTIAGLVR